MNNERITSVEKLRESIREEFKPQLRDQFAMAALTGMVSESDPKNAARWAYLVADAMLEARKQ